MDAACPPGGEATRMTMVMIVDEIDEAYSPGGQRKMMNDGGRADDAFYEITQWPSVRPYKRP